MMILSWLPALVALWAAAFDAIRSSSIPGWAVILLWVALAIMIAGVTMVAASNLDDRKANRFDALFSSHLDSTSAELALWRRAVEAARFAHSAMSPDEFGKVRPVLRELRLRLLERGLDVVSEDLAVQVERLASTAFGPGQK